MDRDQTTKLRIHGMTCDSCAAHVQNALKAVPGVRDASVPDWRSGAAEVVADPTMVVSSLVDAVERAGYRARFATAPPGTAKDKVFDLIVVGTGAGGMAAAIRAAELGKRVAIVESGTIGGTCVNVGCVPSKKLVAAATLRYGALNPAHDGLSLSAGSVNWQALVADKERLVEEMRDKKYIDVLDRYGKSITLLNAHAQVAADGEILLDDGRTFTASAIVLATGARPNIPAVEGIEDVEVLTSRSVMELDALPASLIVVGGRAVALEMGQVFARMGTQVTIVQRSDQILPEHESEVAQGLAEALESEGIRIVTGASLRSVRQEGQAIFLKVAVKGKEQELSGEKILMATGVRPNIEELGLDEAGVDTDDRGFVIVDDHHRTSNPRIYAVGDVTTAPKLVYLAAAAGTAAANAAFAEVAPPFGPPLFADVVFTDPQVARVGLSEADALIDGYDAQAVSLGFQHIPRAAVTGRTQGLIRMVRDAETDRLLGVQIVGPEAGEMIQTAALAIRFGLTVQDLSRTLFPYLTFAEGLKLAAQSFDKDPALLSCCAG